jgi:hypothetical protein
MKIFNTHIRYFLFLIFVSQAINAQNFSKQADNETNGWYGPYSGQDNTVPYIPDKYAVYSLFVVDRSKLDKNTYIQVNGEFGNARYMSYNIYDGNELTSLRSIIDKQIEPDMGFQNPFNNNGKKGERGNLYTINILPDNLNTNQEIKNKLLFSNKIQYLVVMLRYYVPIPDYMGGVPFPKIIGKNNVTGKEEKLTLINPINAKSKIDISEFTKKLNYFAKKTGKLKSILLFRAPANGLLDNSDAKYLIGSTIVNKDQVAVIKLKTPTFPKESDNVRYWSLNIGDNKTFTFNGIKDEDAVRSKNGWTYFVFGRKNSLVEEKCKSSKLNFIEWKMPTDTAFILYRNLVSKDFRGKIEKVPMVKIEESIISKIRKLAILHIGSSSPQGKKMAVKQFLKKNY